jgi:hypothetical protein
VSGDLAQGFPQPTRLLASAFADLQIARSDNDAARAKLGALSALARPWDPATCPPLLRRDLWVWLDSVAAWLNHEYTWRADHVIPSCWPAHPHIAHELAVLACLRLSAGHALTADPLEDWHRYALPTFFDRMLGRLGGTPCQPGSHKPWPGQGRYADYESPGAIAKRRAAFDHDGGPPGHRPPGSPPDSNGRARSLTVVAAPRSPDGTTT